MHYGAVILAAGISSRMEEFKPMLPMGRESVIQTVIHGLQKAGVETIVIVTGYHRAMLERHLFSESVMFVYNERFAQTKMFDSVCLGLQRIEGCCNRVFLIPADIPLVQPETLKLLMACQAECVRPLYRGEPGHPLLLDSSAIPKILSATGQGGLRGAIQEIGLMIHDVEVEDEGTVLDMDTPQQYSELLRKQGDRKIRIKNKLVVGTDKLFFGPETAQLLEMVDLTGSITAASEAMHMSYSKAWKMLNLVEEELGYKVVLRHNGGTEGGGTFLTAQGKRLLASYRGMQQELKKAADRLLAKYFGQSL